MNTTHIDPQGITEKAARCHICNQPPPPYTILLNFGQGPGTYQCGLCDMALFNVGHNAAKLAKAAWIAGVRVGLDTVKDQVT